MARPSCSVGHRPNCELWDHLVPGLSRLSALKPEMVLLSLDELERAYHLFLESLGADDVTAFMAQYSRQPGVVLIGTAPDELFVGHAAIADVANRVLPIIHRAGLTFRPRAPQVSIVGEMG